MAGYDNERYPEHPFVDKIVFVDSKLPFSEKEKAWHIEQNYHHYLFKVIEVYDYYGNGLCANTRIHSKIPGLPGNEDLDHEFACGTRVNIKLDKLSLYQSSNKDGKHVLTTLED